PRRHLQFQEAGYFLRHDLTPCGAAALRMRRRVRGADQLGAWRAPGPPPTTIEHSRSVCVVSRRRSMKPNALDRDLTLIDARSPRCVGSVQNAVPYTSMRQLATHFCDFAAKTRPGPRINRYDFRPYNFSTWANSSSTGVARPKIDTATLRRERLS